MTQKWAEEEGGEKKRQRGRWRAEDNKGQSKARKEGSKKSREGQKKEGTQDGVRYRGREIIRGGERGVKLDREGKTDAREE